TVAVAIDRNDKDLFPPVLPAALGIALLAAAALLVFRDRPGLAFAGTALGILAGVATLFTSLYPRVMVSSTDFGNSLTVESASSTHYALAVMTVVALIVTPIVLLYQGWTFYVLRARVGGDEVESPVAAVDRATGAELVRLLDPPLARRARSVRRLLAVDTALGLGAALLVLAQAVLIAHVAAEGFAGASLEEVRTPLAALVLVTLGRAASTWAFETLGRRAATDVVSGLRLDLV